MSSEYNKNEFNGQIGNEWSVDNSEILVSGIQNNYRNSTIIHKHYHQCQHSHHQKIPPHQNKKRRSLNKNKTKPSHTRAILKNPIHGQNVPIITDPEIPFYQCLSNIFKHIHYNWKFHNPSSIILRINDNILGPNDGNKLKKILQKIPLNKAIFIIDRLTNNQQIISSDHSSNNKIQSRSQKQSISRSSQQRGTHHKSLCNHPPNDTQSMSQFSSFSPSINNTTTKKKRGRDGNKDNLPPPKRHKNGNGSSSFIDDSDNHENEIMSRKNNSQRNDDDDNNKYVEKKKKRKGRKTKRKN